MIELTADNIERYSASPLEFARDLDIEIDSSTIRWGDRMRPFQADFIDAVSPGLKRAIGLPIPLGETIKLRSIAEWPRGHAKTSMIAALIIWAMLFAPRLVRFLVAACDREQAGLTRNAIALLCRLNPEVGAFFEVCNWTVRIVDEAHPGNGSELTIISSDVASSWGHLVDAVFCDEVSIWPKGDLFYSLLSTVAKKASAFLGIITNAGNCKGEDWESLDNPPKKQPGENWFWRVRESARLNPAYAFARLAGPDETILTPDRIAELQRDLPPGHFRRAILNEWIDEGGETFTRGEIEKLVTLDGPEQWPIDGCVYIAGLDLGANRDHSALVSIGIDFNRGRLFLASSESWNPADYGGQLDFAIVKAAVLSLHRKLGLTMVCFDRWNADFLAAELQRAGVAMVPIIKNAETLNRMALALLETIRGAGIDLFDEPLLVRDLSRVSITERQNGFKIELPRDTVGGHGDRCESLCLALPSACDILQGRLIVNTDPNDVGFTIDYATI